MEFSKMALELCNLAEQIFAHFSTPVFKKISNANYTNYFFQQCQWIVMNWIMTVVGKKP